MLIIYPKLCVRNGITTELTNLIFFGPNKIFLGQVNVQSHIRSAMKHQQFNSIERWEEYKETVATFDLTSLRAQTLLDHMSTTKDTSDYLWYTFR